MTEPLVCAILLTKDRPEMKRKCRTCGAEGGVEVFRRRRDASTLQTICRSCEIKRQRELMASKPSKTRRSNPQVYKNYKARNPEKSKAHIAVRFAIERGELIRQACENCGAKQSQAHHEDYGKPLDVKWLCHKCHRKEHRKYV